MVGDIKAIKIINYPQRFKYVYQITLYLNKIPAYFDYLFINYLFLHEFYSLIIHVVICNQILII